VFLDHLTIFDPRANLVLRGGDAIAPTKEDLQSLNFSFQIPALAQERDLYVRVESMSSRLVFVDVQPFHTAMFAMKRQDSLWAALLVLSTILALWGALQWWYTREKVIGVYAIKQSVTTLWLFFFSGYGRLFLGPWLEPGVLTTIAAALVPCLMASILVFNTVLIQTYKPAKFCLYLCYALAVLLALMPLAQFFGLTRESLKLSNTLAPVALLLMQRNATVTIAHSRTRNLEETIRRADIVVAAVGRAEMVKGSWLKPGAVVIDVGINSVDDPSDKRGYRLVGDAAFEECRAVASKITPVPGGVGPMTIAMLLRNTVNGTRRTALAAQRAASDAAPPAPPATTDA
jgi:hypothetical protein